MNNFISNYEIKDEEHDIDTLDKYLNLPLNKRQKTVWFWPCSIYLTPITMKRDLRSKNQNEWEKFYLYVYSNYPVQFFFRHTLDIQFSYIKRNIRELYYKLKYRIENPHKEMRDSVFPPAYQDLPNIIIKFHMECLIEYVEREDCFGKIDWDSSKEHKKIAKLIRYYYDYAKSGRDQLQKNLDAAYDRVDSHSQKPYLVMYRDVLDAENKLKESDTKLCKWVIDNREHLWS